MEGYAKYEASREQAGNPVIYGTLPELCGILWRGDISCNGNQAPCPDQVSPPLVLEELALLFLRHGGIDKALAAIQAGT